MDVYCAECGGMVNAGSACPRMKRPDNCPLKKTEHGHYADLEKQANRPAKDS